MRIAVVVAAMLAAIPALIMGTPNASHGPTDSEVEKLVEGKLDLSTVHGLQWAPLSERALGLSPRQFWALVATKPGRTLH